MSFGNYGSTNPTTMGMREALAAEPFLGSVGNGADTTEDTLLTQPLPPNVTGANQPQGIPGLVGKTFLIEAWGTIAAQTGNKTFKVYFGATVIATGVGTGANAGKWYARAILAVTGNAAQKAFGRVEIQTTGGTPVAQSTLTTSTPAEATAGAAQVNVKITGQSSNGAALDVTLEGCLITEFK